MKKKPLKHKNHFYLLLLAVSALAIVLMIGFNVLWIGPPSVPVIAHPRLETSSESRLLEAFQGRQSDFQVQVTAPVIKILPDDNEGSRHQKFLIRLPTGQTILVSHNIDLAPRIEGLFAGDVVTVAGEYEWNEKGGVIHWTHHDPRGVHPGGWIERDGKRFE